LHARHGQLVDHLKIVWERAFPSAAKRFRATWNPPTGPAGVANATPQHSTISPGLDWLVQLAIPDATCYLVGNDGNGHCGFFTFADLHNPDTFRDHIQEGAATMLNGNLYMCDEHNSPAGAAAGVSRVLMSEMCHDQRMGGNDPTSSDAMQRTTGLLARLSGERDNWAGWIDKSMWLSTTSHFTFIFAAYLRQWLLRGDGGKPPRLVVFTAEPGYELRPNTPYLAFQENATWCYTFALKSGALSGVSSESLHANGNHYRLRGLETFYDNAAVDKVNVRTRKTGRPLKLEDNDIVVVHYRNNHYVRLFTVGGASSSQGVDAGAVSDCASVDGKSGGAWRINAKVRWQTAFGDLDQLFADAVYLCRDEESANAYVAEHAAAEPEIKQYVEDNTAQYVEDDTVPVAGGDVQLMHARDQPLCMDATASECDGDYDDDELEDRHRQGVHKKKKRRARNKPGGAKAEKR